MIRIVLADDHPAILDAVRRYLEPLPDLEVVAAVDQGTNLETVVREHRPDLLILDLEMEQGFNPAETVPRLRAIHPDLKVLVFSAHDETTWVLRMLEAEADGYVLKTEPPFALTQAVRAVMDGEP